MQAVHAGSGRSRADPMILLLERHPFSYEGKSSEVRGATPNGRENRGAILRRARGTCREHRSAHGSARQGTYHGEASIVPLQRGLNLPPCAPPAARVTMSRHLLWSKSSAKKCKRHVKLGYERRLRT
jgi:hypothetical protein